MLGAIAAETRRIHIGPLVARATLRPAATLANSLATVQRVSGGRLIAAIGAGDSFSRDENEAYGLEFGSMVDRVNALHAAVRAVATHDYPVWVAGRAAPVRQMVAVADGWNSWDTDPARFVGRPGPSVGRRRGCTRGAHAALRRRRRHLDHHRAGRLGKPRERGGRRRDARPTECRANGLAE
jgi:hypothetical protein